MGLVKRFTKQYGRSPNPSELKNLKKMATDIEDAETVIQFPPGGKDRIDPFKPRPTQPVIPVTVKDKTTKMTPEGIMEMLTKQNKDINLGQAPKTTKVKEAVDPKLEMQESTRELYKRLTRQNREAIKNFKKRNKPKDDE